MAAAHLNLVFEGIFTHHHLATLDRTTISRLHAAPVSLMMLGMVLLLRWLGVFLVGGGKVDEAFCVICVFNLLEETRPCALTRAGRDEHSKDRSDCVYRCVQILLARWQDHVKGKPRSYESAPLF
jgi:hypothetical protein